MSAITFACFVLGSLSPPSNPYCTESYCPVGQTNVGCNPPTSSTMAGTFCEGSTPRVIVIDEAMQNYLTDQVNQIRQQYVTKVPAVRMPTVTWDAELAELAAINARVCTTEHDECMNTADYRYVGQNLQFVVNDVEADFSFITEISLLYWESSVAIMDEVIDGFPENPNRSEETAYMMYVDKMDKVGCGLHEWKASDATEYYYKFVCNFSVGPKAGQPVFIKGQSATQCLTGTNPKYNLLCSESEVIDPVPHDG